MYGEYEILEEKTKEEFGYSTGDLKKGSHKPVWLKCRRCGIEAIKEYKFSQRRHLCPSIQNGEKWCYKCKKFLPLLDFSKNRHTLTGYQKVCKECFANYSCVQAGYKKKSFKMKSDLKAYFRQRISSISFSCRRKNIICTLEKDDIYDLFLKQKGKCFYTGKSISRNSGIFQHDSVSIDRIDPTKGYTKENIVLCCFAINSLKGSLSIEEFVSFVKEIIPGLSSFIKELDRKYEKDEV